MCQAVPYSKTLSLYSFRFKPTFFLASLQSVKNNLLYFSNLKTRLYYCSKFLWSHKGFHNAHPCKWSESTPVLDTHNAAAHFTQEQRRLGCQVPLIQLLFPTPIWKSLNEKWRFPHPAAVLGKTKTKIKHQHRVQFSFCDERAGDQDDSRWPQVCLWRVHRQCEALLSEFILNRQAVVQLLAFTQRGIGTAHPFHILITLQAVQHTLPSAPQPCLFWQALCKFYLLKHKWINIVNY